MLKKSYRFRGLWYAVVTSCMMWLLFYAPTPYVVYEPGIVSSLSTVVKLDDQMKSSEGKLMMTTVKLTYSNLWRALQTSWDSNMGLYLKKDVLKGYSVQAYSDRMQVIMKGSQNNAIEAAYRQAHIPYEKMAHEVAVSDRSPSAAKGQLQAGDVIHGIQNGTRIHSVRELTQAAAAQQQLDRKLRFDVLRGTEKIVAHLTLPSISEPVTEDNLAELLGDVSPTEIQSLETAAKKHRLSIEAGDIGGPSAGLMFALQGYDLLTPGDLTRGLNIAGTGTIDPTGEVGPIGGVSYKIVAAAQANAQLFLVPINNYKEASAKAKSIGTSMIIVPVRSLEEAILAIEDASP